MSEGPQVLNPTDLIPITPFAKGAGLPVFTSQEDWENIVRKDPYAILDKMLNAVDGALKTARADVPHIDFRVWAFKEMEGEGKKRVRLRAALYVTEEGQHWIHLSRSPQGLKRNRGR